MEKDKPPIWDEPLTALVVFMLLIGAPLLVGEILAPGRSGLEILALASALIVVTGVPCVVLWRRRARTGLPRPEVAEASRLAAGFRVQDELRAYERAAQIEGRESPRTTTGVAGSAASVGVPAVKPKNESSSNAPE